MENINCYLMIIIALMAFYLVLMLYIKYGYKKQQQSNFTPVDSGIPAVEELPKPIVPKFEQNVYETEDTRMMYPLLPPVNPMALQRVIKSDIPANPDLYSSQTYESSDYILDTPPTANTNQLLYSGGNTELISVPLQYNYPYPEQLRSQPVLITPYNKIKYGNC